MQRVSELVGKPIVVADSGQKVGSAADLLVNARGDHLVGIVISEGMLSSERVLPYEEVQTLGRDAIIARSQQRVLDAREWHQRGVDASRSSSLKDKSVVTADGRRLGKINDVYVNELSGEIEAYEVSDRMFANLISRRRVLPRSGEVTLGHDVVVVSGDAADRLDTSDDGGVGGAFDDDR